MSGAEDGPRFRHETLRHAEGPVPGGPWGADLPPEQGWPPAEIARHRIRHADASAVLEVDGAEWLLVGWCAHPDESVPIGLAGRLDDWVEREARVRGYLPQPWQQVVEDLTSRAEAAAKRRDELWTPLLDRLATSRVVRRFSPHHDEEDPEGLPRRFYGRLEEAAGWLADLEEGSERAAAVEALLTFDCEAVYRVVARHVPDLTDATLERVVGEGIEPHRRQATPPGMPDRLRAKRAAGAIVRRLLVGDRLSSDQLWSLYVTFQDRDDLVVEMAEHPAADDRLWRAIAKTLHPRPAERVDRFLSIEGVAEIAEVWTQLPTVYTPRLLLRYLDRETLPEGAMEPVVRRALTADAADALDRIERWPADRRRALPVEALRPALNADRDAVRRRAFELLDGVGRGVDEAPARSGR